MAIARAVKAAKASKYPKKPCPVCDKMWDPRGLGAHMKMHKALPPQQQQKDVLLENLLTSDDKDPIMVPVSRSLIKSLIKQLIEEGVKKL